MGRPSGLCGLPHLQNTEPTKIRPGFEEHSMSREAILKSMLTGVNPVLSDAQMKSIAVVMNAFSGKQLESMDGAGVRIWPFVKGLPPEYQVQNISDLGSPAEYNQQYRTIRISPASLRSESTRLNSSHRCISYAVF